MTIHLPPRIERIVNDAVLSGQYHSAEDVLAEAIAVWQARQTAAAAAAEPTEDDRQAAIERLKSFGKTHQLSLGGLTIKQLRDEARP
jgi:Arc/MetJ-type ribon-helix-helix transcriptional regulator